MTETTVSTSHPRIMRESEIGTRIGGLRDCLEQLERAIRVRDNDRIRSLLFDMVETAPTPVRGAGGELSEPRSGVFSVIESRKM